jgi:hypothetical protein
MSVELLLVLCVIGAMLFVTIKLDAKENEKNKEKKYINIESNDVNDKEGRKMPKEHVTDESYKEEDYNTARFISKVFAFIGWVVVTIGIIVAFIGFATTNELMLMLPGLYSSFGGLVTVAFGQIMRATVDNASHTKEIAKNSKEMLELKVLEIEKKYKKV